MIKRLSPKTWFIVGITLVLALVWFGVDTLLAQGPGRSPRGGSPIDTFTYQGQLTDNSVPANGLYDFRFSIYDAEMGGNLIDSTFQYDDWPVANGTFTVNLPGGSRGSTFNGDGRWLLVEVRPGASVGAYTALPRQAIAAVPYAFSLRPGAVISSTAYAADGWILKVNSDGTTHTTASAILATSATGYAVHGDSTTFIGLYGTTADGYGVYGFDGGGTQARGYGGYFYSSNGVGVYGESNGTRTHPNIYSPGVYGKSTNGVGVYGRNDSATVSWTSAGVLGWGRSNPGGKFLSYSGNLIEGWEDQNGDGYVQNLRFKVNWGGSVYADGSYNCGLGASCLNTGIGADVAERIDTRAVLEPGDVVEIDPENETQFRPSRTAYSGLVAGVVSTNPAITMNNNDLADNSTGIRTDERPLLALVGQVPVKVTAENGSIQPGDLLVASSTPGHAMRAGANPPAGTIIGKALETFKAGTGVIKMLVMLR